MDDTPGAAPAPTPKQQLSDTIKNATSLVITTNKNPSIDQIAAAIALQQILQKMDKAVELVINASVPSKLSFLPLKSIHDHLQGNRDFIIQLDITKTEADKLKYVPENGKLKVYITPYNGNFKEEDVSFAYGDFHCDGIIGFGVEKLDDLDDSIRKEPKLTESTPLLTINAGPSSTPENGKSISWHDPTASSVCEMVMSLTEALQSGLLDHDIATSLLTGIVDKTLHFTSPGTTPKVMTMAAQLLAAGARQAEVVENLNKPDEPAKNSEGQKKSAKQNEKPGNEVQLRQPEASAGGAAVSAPQASPLPTATAPDRVESLSSIVSPPASQPAPSYNDPLASPLAEPINQPATMAQENSSFPQHEKVVQPPAAANAPMATNPLAQPQNNGFANPMASQVSSAFASAPIAAGTQPQMSPPVQAFNAPASTSPASAANPQENNEDINIEAARRAVEDAVQSLGPNPEDAATNFQNPPEPTLPN